MKKIFHDFSGKEYTLDILTQNELKEKSGNISYEEIVRTAWNMQNNFQDGVAQLDVSTGQLTGGSYSTGSGDIQGEHLIDLFCIRSSEEIPDDQLLDDIEYKDMLDQDMYAEEYCEKNGIDYNDRVVEYFLFFQETQDAIDEAFLEGTERIY